MLWTAARFTGWPSTAPLRSTRCSHSQPALANALAWAAGLSLNTVARAMSPRNRRTHLPSLRSMAGKRSIAARGLADRAQPCQWLLERAPGVADQLANLADSRLQAA